MEEEGTSAALVGAAAGRDDHNTAHNTSASVFVRGAGAAPSDADPLLTRARRLATVRILFVTSRDARLERAGNYA